MGFGLRQRSSAADGSSEPPVAAATATPAGEKGDLNQLEHPRAHKA